MEILLVAFVLVFVIIAIVANATRTRQLNDRFRLLANRYHGTLRTGSGFRLPTVDFLHRGQRARVDVHRTGGEDSEDFVQVHLSWPDTALRCEICPETLFHRLGKLLGTQDIEIGVPEFDSRYLIQGNSPGAIRRLLTPPVRILINSLRSLAGTDEIFVRFSRGLLLVKKRDSLQDAAKLDRFVKLSLELCEQGFSPDSTGIEFVEASTDAATETAREAICQVCGEAIVHDVVYCRSCRTPHHRECWEYFGACSTYGCRETRCHR